MWNAILDLMHSVINKAFLTKAPTDLRCVKHNKKLLATREDFRASETGRSFGEITGNFLRCMINPGWMDPGKAHVGLQHAAACRTSRNKPTNGEAWVRVLDESWNEGGAWQWRKTPDVWTTELLWLHKHPQRQHKGPDYTTEPDYNTSPAESGILREG